MSNPDDIKVTLHTIPPSPAQQAAWAWLWRRLLAGKEEPNRGIDPQNVDASEVAIPEASQNTEPAVDDEQAAATASTSPCDEKEISDGV